MQNKRGMSAVVTTLIIILLVIVALGIIWVVIRNVLNAGKEQVELSQKCRDVSLNIKTIEITDKISGNWDDYKITISRTGSGENATKAKILLGNATFYSDVIDFEKDLTPLSTKTNTFLETGVANATTIEITPYFISDKGKELLCSNTFTEDI